MLSKHDLLSRGLKINKNNALDFIIYKTGCATKQYQRKLKNMEQDLLTEVESTIEKIQEEEPDNLEDIEKLKSQHKAVLEQISERESAKLKTFKILEDEKPSKGMIALEKKLSGYTNITML